MAKMNALAKDLLQDLEILLEDIIDADQHLNPETEQVYPSILKLCKKIIGINDRFGLAHSPAIESVASR